MQTLRSLAVLEAVEPGTAQPLRPVRPAGTAAATPDARRSLVLHLRKRLGL